VKINPEEYKFVPGQSTLEEVDLDRIAVFVDGQRYTEAAARRDGDCAQQALRQGLVPGGKSLSGGRAHSPRFQVVLGEATAEKVRRAASEAEMSVSRWLRRTVEEKLAS